MKYPGGVTDDRPQEYTNEQLVEIRRKLYGKDKPPTDLLEKLKEVHSSIDQVHSTLAVSNCPTDIYNLLSPVMALAKLDLLDVRYLVNVLQNICDANKNTCELQEKEIKTLMQTIEDYKYVCEVDKIPKLIIENPGWMRSIKITPFSELTGEEQQWAQKVINEYESGENKVVTHEEEIERLQKIIDLKESERKAWADMCIKKQTIIETAWENCLLGNVEEVSRVIYSALKPETPQSTTLSK